MNYSKLSEIKRRQFLQATGLGLTLFHIAPGRVLRAAEGGSANAKINVAGIGIGSQGGGDIDAVAGEGHNIVALCDVDENYAAKKFAQYPKAKRFKDFRVMLDQMDKEIDAVVIGTPDHTHAVIAMEAMKRGKHVYCEKPLAHSSTKCGTHDAAQEIQGRHTARQPGPFQRLHPPAVRMGLGRRHRQSAHRSRRLRRLPGGLLPDTQPGQAQPDLRGAEGPGLRSVDRPGAVPALHAVLGALELARLDALRHRHHRRLVLPRDRSVVLGAGSRRAVERPGRGDRL